jgi:two-component system, cell cycle response regulator CpdR
MARILIADDESMLCDMCALALATEGHEVETVHDGSEALDVLNKHRGQFDLLLTDVRMPKMDGIALSLAAARNFPELTILLMTGYADQRERAHGLDALVHDVLPKPFSVASLCGAVSEALTVRTRR